MNEDFIYTYSYTLIILILIFWILFIAFEENRKFFSDSFFTLFLLVLIALGFLIRFFNLTEGGLHMDELWRLDRGREAFLFHDWAYKISSSPLTRILVGAASVFGNNSPDMIDFWARFLLGTIPSTLTIIIVYLVGSRIANRYAGLLSAFFVTFSFSHLQMSRTFMSEPYLVFFVSLTCLLFLMSLEKPHFIYATMVSLVLTCLIKETGYPLIFLLFSLYIYYTFEKKIPWKQLLGAMGLFSVLFVFLTPYLVSTGNVVNLFLGPLNLPLAQVHSNQAVPWLYHYSYFLEIDTVIFIGVILAVIIAVWKRDENPLILILLANALLLFVTYITFKANDVFHRHLVTVIPLFAVLAGYSFSEVFAVLQRHQKTAAYAFIIMLLCLPPVNLCLHDGRTTRDTNWIHYNINVRLSDSRQIAHDLRELPGNPKIAVFLFSQFETSVYGSMINYYYVDNFTTFSNFSPRLFQIPLDEIENLGGYAKANGISYVVYNGNTPEIFDPDDFSPIKKYADGTTIFRYTGPEIRLGESSGYPSDNPFRLIDEGFYNKNFYSWIEAETADFSTGQGYRAFDDEAHTGIYGIASGGAFHFIRNNGTYSTYFLDIPEGGLYRVWFRFGAYAPLNAEINGSIYRLFQNTSRFSWYSVGPVFLPQNRSVIRVFSEENAYIIYDAILVTSDLSYVPVGVSKPLSASGVPDQPGGNGYSVWQDGPNWTIGLYSNKERAFSGNITTSSPINAISSTKNSIAIQKIDDFQFFFATSRNFTGSDSIEFITKSRYITLDLR